MVELGKSINMEEGEDNNDESNVFRDEIEDNTEKNKLHNDHVLKVLSVGAVVALLSPSKSLELFLSLQSCKFWCSKK